MDEKHMLWLIIAFILGFFLKHITQNLVCKNVCPLVEGTTEADRRAAAERWMAGIEDEDEDEATRPLADRGSRVVTAWDREMDTRAAEEAAAAAERQAAAVRYRRWHMRHGNRTPEYESEILAQNIIDNNNSVP